MFSRKSTAERTAAQAWDYLAAAVAATGEHARSAGQYGANLAEAAEQRSAYLADEAAKRSSRLAGTAGKASKQTSKLAKQAGKRSVRLADDASSKVGAAADEAWHRANAAANALAGRRPPTPWGLIVGASLLGLALGWAAAVTARAALARAAENDELEMAERPTIPTPTFDN
jgi:hypothetical protein